MAGFFDSAPDTQRLTVRMRVVNLAFRAVR